MKLKNIIFLKKQSFIYYEGKIIYFSVSPFLIPISFSNIFQRLTIILLNAVYFIQEEKEKKVRKNGTVFGPFTPRERNNFYYQNRLNIPQMSIY